MAKLSDVKITLDIEPLVKVQCLTKDCKNNIVSMGCCNFKWVTIKGGACQSYEPKQAAPNHGPCAVCGRDVIHTFPGWTGNPSKLDSRPLHNSPCGRLYYQWEVDT